MKILVTGAAGFMGSHLVDYLVNEGHEVWALDDLSIGKQEYVNPKAKFVFCDLTRASLTEEVVKECKPEVIYHLASWAHEGLSQFMPKLITENNYNAFLNVIVPAIASGVKHVVVTSSMSVYGDQEAPFNEDMPTKPVDIYAIAKASMEKALEVLADVHGFTYTILRPHNVYGVRQMLDDPYRNVVGIFMNRILNGKPPIIYGDGHQTRAFSYIDDVTPCIARAGFEPAAVNQIINIGPTEEYTINDLAALVLAYMDSDLEPVYYPDRPREVKHAYCTNDKAIERLGYKTTVSFEEGIKRMATWAKEQGPQEFHYLDNLELEKNAPQTWSKKEM